MERQKEVLFVVLTWLFIIQASCVSIAPVHSFAESATTVVSGFDEIHFGFENYCRDRCLQSLEMNGDIRRELSCNCALYQSADSITQVLYSSVKNYLDALSKISGNEIASVNTDVLTKTISTGKFGNIEINDSHVKALGDISNILLRMITDHYRKRKTMEIMRMADSSFQVLTEKFSFIMEHNLAPELDFKKENLYVSMKEIFSTEKLNAWERIQLSSMYYAQWKESTDQQLTIRLYAAGLHSIARAHHRLATAGGNESKDELWKELVQFISDLDQINTDLKKLKH